MSNRISDEALDKWIYATSGEPYDGLGRQETDDIHLIATELRRRRDKTQRFNSLVCAECGKSILDGTVNYSYMTEDRIWKEAGFKYSDFAHITCLEERIGRKLVAADFKNVPINRLILWILEQGLQLPD